jgi:hypothetical protein
MLSECFLAAHIRISDQYVSIPLDFPLNPWQFRPSKTGKFMRPEEERLLTIFGQFAARGDIINI